MPDLTKIATCSYCGTRSILHLSGKVQHELACSSCGAKLHTMKALKRAPTPKTRAKSARRPAQPRRRKPKKTERRRTPFLWHALEEIWDEVEDFFD